MVTTRLTVKNEVGLHARPAAQFAKAAAAFSSSVQLRKDGAEVNAKSVLAILTLGLSRGDTFDLSADGDDAEEALSTLTSLVDEL